MRRRSAIVALLMALLLPPERSFAQPAAKIPRIGYLGPGASTDGIVDGFREGLKQLGYVEGQNSSGCIPMGIGQVRPTGRLCQRVCPIQC
jgi:hypothetical protein